MLATAHASASPRSPLSAASELGPQLAKLLPELYGRALRMTRNSALAEDVVQDTIERALRFEAQYERGTNLRAWVQKILFSVFVTRCRRSRRERNALDSLASDPCSWTANDAAPLMAELSPPTARAVDALPHVFRDAVMLVDLGELSYKDAAATLGVPVGTVMSRLHRGRRLLADALAASSTERQSDAASRAELEPGPAVAPRADSAPRPPAAPPVAVAVAA